MFMAYEKGISPKDWRESNKSDFDFIRAWQEISKQKQIRINNKQSLLREMGY